MTRVLLVSPFACEGGAERAFASLVRGLPAHGFEPVPALLDRGPLEGLVGGCELIDADPSRPFRLRDSARTAAALGRLARRAGARAVVSSKSLGHLYGGPGAALAGLPAVWWMHDQPPEGALYRRREPWRHYRIEEAARRIRAARVVCGNDRAVRIQRSRTPRSRVVGIRPGVAVGELAARRGEGAALRRELGLGDAPLVGVVGRLSRPKGQDVFLSAAADIARRRPDVRFALVGGPLLDYDRPFERRLQSLSAAGPLAGRVLLPGHQDDPVPWLDALDVAVIPSLTEAGPLVLGEALALGKPVVATRVGAVAEAVEHGRDGLLVAPRDPAAMTAAIDRLLDDPDLGRRLRAAAPAAAHAFCELAMAERFASMLEEIV